MTTPQFKSTTGTQNPYALLTAFVVDQLEAIVEVKLKKFLLEIVLRSLRGQKLRLIRIILYMYFAAISDIDNK